MPTKFGRDCPDRRDASDDRLVARAVTARWRERRDGRLDLCGALDLDAQILWARPLVSKGRAHKIWARLS